MYSLDINFLKDRAGDPGALPGGERPSLPAPAAGSVVPLVIGGIVLLAAVAIPFGLKALFENQRAQLTQERDAVQQEIATVAAQVQEVNQLTEQIAQVNADTEALIGVFGRVTPLYSVIEAIAEQTPAGVQIKGLTVGSLAPSSSIQVTGTAASYPALNDFLLLLKDSPLIDNVVLASASVLEQQQNLQAAGLAEGTTGNIQVEPVDVVEYAIDVTLTDQPAIDLLPELERLGADGLVTRVEELRSKGIL